MAKARAGLADGVYEWWLTRIREMPRAGPSLALLLGLGAACADPGDTERPSIVWEGEHLRVGGDLTAVCGGNLEYMDAYVGGLRRRLSAVGDAKIDYYYLGMGSVDAPLSPYCDAGESDALLACTNADQEVFSRAIPQEHELVHAVHAERGFSHPFLEEGLAEYYGDDARYSVRDTPVGRVEDALLSSEGGGLGLGYYAVAGHFASFLEDELATDYVPLLDAIGFDNSANRLKLVVGAAFDDDFADVERIYEGKMKCPHASFRNAGTMCDVAPPLFDGCAEGDGETALAEVHVECSAGDVLGPRDGEIWTYRTIDVTTPGSYYMLAVGGETAFADGIEIKRCSGGCDAPPVRLDVYDDLVEEPIDDVPFPIEVELAQGRYLVRITRPEGEATTVRFELEGPGCV